MTRKNLRSDAALRRAIKEFASHCKGEDCYEVSQLCGNVMVRDGDIIIQVTYPQFGYAVAEVSFKQIISKRKALKGIKAVLTGKTPAKRKAGKRK